MYSTCYHDSQIKSFQVVVRVTGGFKASWHANHCTFTTETLTVGGALTDSSAWLAVVGVPLCVDLDLDTVRGPDIQLTQNHPILLYVADPSGL